MKCETRGAGLFKKNGITNYARIWEQSQATVLKMTSVEL
jgi:hypothetical protein